MHTQENGSPLGWVSVAAAALGVVALIIAFRVDDIAFGLGFLGLQVVAIVTGIVARRSAPGKAGAILGGAFVALAILASGFFMSDSQHDEGPTEVTAVTP